MLLEVLPQIKQEIVNRKRVDMQLTKRIEVPNKTVQAIRMASKFNDRLPYVCNELFEMTKNISDDKTGGDGTNIAEGFEFTPRIFDTYWVAKNRWENEEISWKYSWRYPADPFEGSDDYFYCCEQLAESSDVSDNIKIAQSFLSDGLFYLIRKVGRDSEFEEISLITSSPQIGAMFFDSMAGYCAAILEKNISGDLFAFVLTPNMVGNDVLWSAEVCSEEIAILMDFDDYESDSKTVVCIPEAVTCTLHFLVVPAFDVGHSLHEGLQHIIMLSEQIHRSFDRPWRKAVLIECSVLSYVRDGCTVGCEGVADRFYFEHIFGQCSKRSSSCDNYVHAPLCGLNGEV